MSEMDLSTAAHAALHMADCGPRDGRSPHFRACELMRSDIETVGLSAIEPARRFTSHLPQPDRVACECYDAAQGPGPGWGRTSIRSRSQGTYRGEAPSDARDRSKGACRYVKGLAGGR